MKRKRYTNRNKKKGNRASGVNTGNQSQQNTQNSQSNPFAPTSGNVQDRYVNELFKYIHDQRNGGVVLTEDVVDLMDEYDMFSHEMDSRDLTAKQLTEIFEKRNRFMGAIGSREAAKNSARPRKRIGAYKEELTELQNLKKGYQAVMDDESASNEARMAASEKVLEYEKKILEVEKEIGKNQRGFGRMLMDIGDLGKDLWKTFQDFNEPWAKASKSASEYAKAVGMSKAAMDEFRRGTIDNVVRSKIAADFNMSTEELMLAQENYAKGIGRNVGVTDNSQSVLAASSFVFGQSANDLMVDYEKYGLSIEDTGKRMAGIYNNALKSGVSLSKYTENVKAGLRMAQKYTFDGGLRNMELMAKRAAAIHMDMEQVAAFAEKVNTVEGSLSTAAKIQVLGGPFSTLSNPLSMLNESINDIGSLQERLAKYTEGMGVLDKQTGEVAISAFNKLRLRQFAEASGTDYAKLIETAQQQAKRGEIDAAIARSMLTLDEDQKELLRNTATFENGVAGVSIDGKFKRLEDLEGKDYDKIRIEHSEDSENIADIAKNVRSLVDQREGYQKQKDALQQKASEKFGLGRLEGLILDFVSHSNFLLGTIIGLTTAGTFYRIGAKHFSPGGAFGKATTLGGPGGGVFRKIFGGSTKTAGNIIGGTGGGATSSVAGKAVSQNIRIATNTGMEYARVGGQWQAVTPTGTRTLTEAQARGIEKRYASQILRKEAESKIGTLESGLQKMNAELGGKATGATARTGGKKASQTAAKALRKSAGKLAGVGAKLAKGGTPMAIAGVIGNIVTDNLVEKGKIKKAGAAHSALKMGSTMAEWAGLGAMLGPWGALGGAAIGAVIGATKVAKANREVAMDAKLERMGLERKGDYGAHQLKKIDKAMAGGKISARLRRKMEREGDFELLEQMDTARAQVKEAKAAKRKERRDRRHEIRMAKASRGSEISRLRSAAFNVDVAHFHGKAFLGGDGRSVVASKAISMAPKIGMLALPSPFRNIAMVGSSVSNAFGRSGDVSRRPKLRIWGNTQADKNGSIGQSSVIIKPTKGEDGSSDVLRAMVDIMSRYPQQTQNHVPQQNGPIEVKINGTLKLDGGNGKSVDIISEIQKNPALLRQVTQLIIKEMNTQQYGGYRSDRVFGNNMPK